MDLKKKWKIGYEVVTQVRGRWVAVEIVKVNKTNIHVDAGLPEPVIIDKWQAEEKTFDISTPRAREFLEKQETHDAETQRKQDLEAAYAELRDRYAVTVDVGTTNLDMLAEDRGRSYEIMAYGHAAMPPMVVGDRSQMGATTVSLAKLNKIAKKADAADEAIKKLKDLTKVLSLLRVEVGPERFDAITTEAGSHYWGSR